MRPLLALLLSAACCEHAPDPTAVDAYARVTSWTGRVRRRCTGASIGPETVATAAHCVDGADLVHVDGVPAQVTACDLSRDVCWLLTAPRASWLPACERWPAGAQGTSPHHWSGPELASVCLSSQAGETTCGDGLRHGSSGAPLVVDGCVAGVLVLHWPTRLGRPGRWATVAQEDGR